MPPYDTAPSTTKCLGTLECSIGLQNTQGLTPQKICWVKFAGFLSQNVGLKFHLHTQTISTERKSTAKTWETMEQGVPMDETCDCANWWHIFLSNWSCPPSQDWFTPGDTTQLQQTGAGPQRCGREKLQGTCPSQRVQCESKFFSNFQKYMC